MGDLMENGHLLNLINQNKKLKIPNVKFYSANIALALEYLHVKRIIFRDLKSSNLMINSDGYLKLIDFGYAKLSAGKAQTLCGSPLYMAPEIFEGKPYGRAVDWWSMGIIIYEMIHGITAFDVADRGNTKAIYKNIKTNKIRFSKDLDETTKEFIQGLLTISPKDRLGKLVNSVWDVNSHQFFSGLNFDQIQHQETIPPPVRINPHDNLKSDNERLRHNDVTLTTPYNGDHTIPHGGDGEQSLHAFSDNVSLTSFSSFNYLFKDF